MHLYFAVINTEDDPVRLFRTCSKNSGTNILVKKVTITILIISRGSPTLAILETLRCPVANTIAFGGVPTGIIKPKLVAIVYGIISMRGFIPMDGASDAEIGISKAAVAVLHSISLDMIATVTMVIITIIISKLPRKISLDAIHWSSPVVVKPLTNARPPPIKIIKPYEISIAFFQFSSLSSIFCI